ncbi:MAG TPA: SAM-dependent methyltransferase [Bryobacteraceae bacterium]|jgi:methyltransferase (TIGR00027 family)
MQAGQPSRTALAAARHRAAHQILEEGRIFKDPLAVRILGEDPAEIARQAEEGTYARGMRMFIAARTRFAEDSLAAAVAERGVSQLVVLGAGLDTYAYRGALRDRLRIFEVDHPSTQAWKRERLAEAAIEVPGTLTYTPVDFERQTLREGLAAAGFDPQQRTFFTWLGVVPYLQKDAIWATLNYIGALPGGAHVVFDYSNPKETFPEELRERHEERAARVAAIGEPWVSFFDTDELRGQLVDAGFGMVDDRGPSRIFSNPKMGDKGGHIVHAASPLKS